MPSEVRNPANHKRSGFRLREDLLLPWAPRKTISSAHAAKLLDVSPDTIFDMIEAGTLQAYKLRPDKPNSPWKINYDSVIAHLEKIHEQNGLEVRFYSEAAPAEIPKSTNRGTEFAPASAGTRRSSQ